jgi:rhomboid protease GluP
VPTCTQCGSEYGAETPSGYCPACDQKVERPEQHEAAPQVSHRELAAGMPVTVAIIAVNCAVLLLMAFRHVSLMSPTSEQLLRFGANHGPLTLDGQWWRLLTNTFLHIGLAHLAVNMWSLWNLGALAERLYGRWLYLFIYLFSGVAGSIASIAWHPGVTSAGS